MVWFSDGSTPSTPSSIHHGFSNPPRRQDPETKWPDPDLPQVAQMVRYDELLPSNPGQRQETGWARLLGVFVTVFCAVFALTYT